LTSPQPGSFGERFSATAAYATAILVVLLLLYNAFSAPPTGFISLYLTGGDGEAPQTGVLQLAEEATFTVNVENNMGRPAKLKIRILLGGDGSSAPAEGIGMSGGLLLFEREVELSDAGAFSLPLRFSVTRARVEGGTLFLDEVEAQGEAKPVAVKAADGGYIRLVSEAWVFEDGAGRFAFHRGQGSASPWAQVWLRIGVGGA